MELGKILLDKIEEFKDKNSGIIDNNNIHALVTELMTILTQYIKEKGEIRISHAVSSISEKLKLAKSEIQTLNPTKFQSSIPGAFSELNAVNEATESSTNKILDAVEIIQQNANNLSDENIKNTIIGKTTEILEACNFQDLTGQRISKVCKIFDEVENAVKILINLFPEEVNNSTNTNTDKNSANDKDLLNGPQLNGPSQSEIDELFKNS